MQFPCGCNITKFDPFDLPDCAATWDLISSGQTKGIFQVESYLGRHWSRKLKPSSIQDLSDLIAIIRPGVLKVKNDKNISMTEVFCNRKNKIENSISIDESIKDIVEPTQQIIVYQEQILQIAKKLCGFNLKEADELRKCVTGDTQFISKTRGWISINRLLEEGYSDDLFLVMNDSGKQEWKAISNIWSNGKKAVKEVITNNGFSIKATHNHQFLTTHGWEARQRLLKTKHELICTNQIQYDGIDKISRNLAMIIAGIVTEGTFTKKSCSFTNYDIEMMNWFSQAVYEEFGVISNRKDKRYFVFNKAEKVKLSKYMKHGYSDTKILPDVMMGMTLESTRDFLSFMLSAECTVSYDRIIYTSKSEALVKQVQLLLLRFGIFSTKGTKFNKKHGIYHIISINIIEDRIKVFNELTQYWFKEKKDRLKQYLYLATNNSNGCFNQIPTFITNRLINQYPQYASNKGGNIRNQPIGKNKFRKWCEETNDKYWIDLSNGPQSYLPIKSINNTKKMEVFDFSMVDTTTPYIIANGFVIHNSIGKKNAKELGELRQKFVDGAVRVGYVNRDKAEQIYDIISASARYSFNQSHSVGYAKIGYITAYIKQHFPLQFYTSWIRYASEDMDPQKELRELVVDARQTGVEICPPRLDFLKERAHSHKGKVYFGLADIKGVGEKKLAGVLPKLTGLAQLTWIQHLDLPIPPKMFELFIQSGALSYLRLPRVQMLEELNVWHSLTDKEKGQIQRKRTLTESLVTSLPTMKMSPARLDIVQGLIYTLNKPSSNYNDTPLVLSRFENELLGIALSCTKAEAVNLSMINAKVEDLHKGAKNAILAVELNEIKVITVKNGANKGKLMCFAQVQDITGQIECVVFPQQYEQFQDVLLKGNTVVIQGYLKDSFIINKIWQA